MQSLVDALVTYLSRLERLNEAHSAELQALRERVAQHQAQLAGQQVLALRSRADHNELAEPL